MSQGVLTPEEVKKIERSLETSPSCSSPGNLQKGGGKSGASGKESGFHGSKKK